jgi:ribosomal protein L31
MERLNEDAQWIVLMGFIVSVGMLFLTIIISQAPLVGQTTAEAVLEFPKDEIQDLRLEVISVTKDRYPITDVNDIQADAQFIAMAQQNAVVYLSVDTSSYTHPFYNLTEMELHYNNGVTEYDENFTIFHP